MWMKKKLGMFGFPANERSSESQVSCASFALPFLLMKNPLIKMRLCLDSGDYSPLHATVLGKGWQLVPAQYGGRVNGFHKNIGFSGIRQEKVIHALSPLLCPYMAKKNLWRILGGGVIVVVKRAIHAVDCSNPTRSDPIRIGIAESFSVRNIGAKSRRRRRGIEVCREICRESGAV